MKIHEKPNVMRNLHIFDLLHYTSALLIGDSMAPIWFAGKIIGLIPPLQEEG